MSPLKAKEIADVIDCLRDIYALTDIGTFGEQLISRLRKLLPCNGILFGNCDLRRMRSEFVAYHPDNWNLPLDQIIANLPGNHQHPYWPHYLKTQDPRATKLSDFLSRREFHSKGFYTELYKPLRAEAEIGCMGVIAPPFASDVCCGHPRRKGLQQWDRVVLNLLQPHLSQACRDAGALTALRKEVSLARKMIEALDHGVIVWSRTGAVRFVTAQARTWLEEYFPSWRRTDELPARLENWLKHQSALFGRRDDVSEPMRPFVVEPEGRKLVVRPIF